MKSCPFTRCRVSILVTILLLAAVPAALADLTFFGWSDQHVGTNGQADHILPAIEAMNKLPGEPWPDAVGGFVATPAFVISLGDLTEWPTNAAMQTYNLLVTRQLRFPSYDLAGNHDSGGKEPVDTAHDWLRRRHGDLSYTFEQGGVHFLMVHSAYDESLNNPAQPISADTLQWLRNQVAEIPQGEPIIVGLHLAFESITNREDLVGALGDANVLAVLGGHYHKATVNEYKGVRFIQLPSPTPNFPDEFTVFRITSDRLTAIPYNYDRQEWVTDPAKMVSAKIDGPAEPAPQPPASSHDIETLDIGDKAPDFSLPGVDGRVWSLRDFSEYPLLAVIFTCNHCPTAQAYEDRIKQLVSDYRPKGVGFVAISPNDPKAVRLDELGYSDMNDSFPEMMVRASERDFNFPYLYDGDTQSVSREYGPRTTPHVFLFDRDRRLRYVGRIDNDEHIGKATQHDTRETLDAMLAGEPVETPTTKTFGCSIKWADKRDGVARAKERWAQEDVKLDPIDLAGVKQVLENDSPNLRLVNFWASWCPPCVAEFPELVDINRMYRNRDFEMITVSLDDADRREEVVRFLKKQQASMHNRHFTGPDKYKLVDTVGHGWEGYIPFTLLVAPGGKVVQTYSGAINPEQAKRDIVNYLGRHYK